MAFGNATKGYVKKHSGGGGGTTNYSELTNKPQINGVTLDGNKTSEQLNITASLTLTECTTDYDERYRRFYIPKTAKLLSFIGVNNQYNDNYRTPFILSINEIETALTNNYSFYLPCYNTNGNATITANEDYYILTYDYVSYDFRIRDVFYI